MKNFFLILKFILFFPIYAVSNPLVESTWLSKNICNDKIKIIEVGLSYNSYLVEHINCSYYTNFYNDGWRINSDGVNMVLPSPEKIVSIIKKLGIKENDHVILYAKKNEEYSVAETTAIYFSFKYIGHNKVSILNGGYPEFKKNHSLLVEEGEQLLEKIKKYNYKVNNSILAKSEHVVINQKKNWPLIDSRETDFFLGINKLHNFKQYGTIKNSINIPSKWFLEGRGLKFNSIDKIKKVYKKVNLTKEENSIFFCYAGLESSLNWFVSHELMQNYNVRLYEGSIFKWVSENYNIYN